MLSSTIYHTFKSELFHVMICVRAGERTNVFINLAIGTFQEGKIT